MTSTASMPENQNEIKEVYSSLFSSGLAFVAVPLNRSLAGSPAVWRYWSGSKWSSNKQT